jgi:Tlde1 domain
MPWVYHQSTGLLEYRAPHSGPTAPPAHRVGHGYSGAPGAVNNPDMEAIHNVGPIPRGRWRIGPLEPHHGRRGPNVMSLTPIGHDAHTRFGFLIHGDNSLENRSASDGCVILGPDIRLRIGHSHDRLLEVVR